MSSKVLTVIITTRHRPEMLADALESVRQQTALKSICQVLVSENGDTDDSRAVCARFTDLPIQYVQQRPPVTSLRHLDALWKHIRGELVAILHDDDWWLPTHVENALAVLEAHPDFTATFSNFLDSRGPSTVSFTAHKAWRVWAATDCDFRPASLRLDKVNVLLACLMESTFHYSTLVGRKEAVWNAYLRILETGNAWDNERLFPVFLAAQGPLGYVTLFTVTVRTHPEQEGFDPAFVAKGLDGMRVKTTRHLAQIEPETTALAVKKFNEQVLNMKPDLLDLISCLVGEPQKTTLIDELGLKLIPSRRSDTSTPWRVVREICPPIILTLRLKLKNYLAARSAR